MRVTSEFHFCAAHRLPHYDGPCRNLHGHNYRLLITLEGSVHPKTGMVYDFFLLKHVVGEEILSRVDHADLNAQIENPTAENIVRWIWARLKPRVALLRELTLYETHDCSVTYGGEDDGR